jgi:DNA-binding MarR family transcriptional regulator
VSAVSARRRAPGRRDLDGVAVWERFLEAHSAIIRELEHGLGERHGLTLSDYDVLVQLQLAGPRGLRPVEIARAVLLTRSGITRLIAGLEEAGLVEAGDCPEDRRGRYVRLTRRGRDVFRRAARDHLGQVDELFVGRFAAADLRALGGLLDRLPRPDRASLAGGGAA